MKMKCRKRKCDSAGGGEEWKETAEAATATATTTIIATPHHVHFRARCVSPHVPCARYPCSIFHFRSNLILKAFHQKQKQKKKWKPILWFSRFARSYNDFAIRTGFTETNINNNNNIENKYRYSKLVKFFVLLFFVLKQRKKRENKWYPDNNYTLG